MSLVHKLRLAGYSVVMEFDDKISTATRVKSAVAQNLAVRSVIASERQFSLPSSSRGDAQVCLLMGESELQDKAVMFKNLGKKTETKVKWTELDAQLQKVL